MKRNWVFFFLTLLALLVSADDERDFLANGKEKWGKKDNTQLVFEDGVLRVEIKPGPATFGWLQHKLPPSAAGHLLGFAGRVRILRGSSQLIAIINHMVTPRIQYRQNFVTLDADDQEWHEFYIPIGKFTQSGTGSTPDTKAFTPSDSLELSFTGLVDPTCLELDSLRMILDDEPVENLRRLESLRLREQLNGRDTPHPRLILHGKKLEEIRAKATRGGVEQAGYESLITWADRYLSWPDGPNWSITASGPFWTPGQASKNAGVKIWPDSTDKITKEDKPAEAPPKKHYDPCEIMLNHKRVAEVNDHRNRGIFEGVLTSAVRPIEPLAAAGLLTGDERYSRKAAELMVKLASVITTDTRQLDYGFFYTRTFYVRALALGYDWCWQVMIPEERATVKATLLGFVLDIYSKCWNQGWGQHPLQRVWNWDPGIVSAAGLGMLALEGETKVQEQAIIFEMRRHLKDYLTLGIDFDGSSHEGPSYISYGIGAGPIFMEALRMQGRGDLFTETNAQLVAPWIAYEMLPGCKSWNNLSDCSLSLPSGGIFYHYAMGRYAELAEQEGAAAKGERLPDPPELTTALPYLSHFPEAPGQRTLSYANLSRLMAWSFNRGPLYDNMLGAPPLLALINVLFYRSAAPIKDPGELLPEAMHFRGRGLAVSRVGFGDQSLHLAVEAGPHASGHDQADKGSFTFRAYGMDAFIDSGYGNDSEPLKSASSYAHNMVLIDGKGEPLTGHNNSNGFISGYRHTPRYDWIRVDADEAWNLRYGAGFIPLKTGMNVKRYRREFVLVRPENGNDIPPYLVIYDDISKQDGKPHDYTWLWHYDTQYNVERLKDRWVLAGNVSNLPILTTTSDSEMCAALFEATIPADGDYRIVGLTAALGPVLDQSDSFYLSVNGEVGKRWELMTSKNFCWSEYKLFGSQIPHKYSFKAGEKVKIQISRRESRAALARLLVIPYLAPLPTTPLDDVPAGVSLGIDDAKDVGEAPFVRTIFGGGAKEKASITVFPVNTADGETECEWFETSRLGNHPRLKHTVKGKVNPHFLMVVVPRQNEKQPLPSIKRISETSLQVVWPSRTDAFDFGSDYPLK